MGGVKPLLISVVRRLNGGVQEHYLCKRACGFSHQRFSCRCIRWCFLHLPGAQLKTFTIKLHNTEVVFLFCLTQKDQFPPV